MEVPKFSHGTIRTAANALGLSRATFHRAVERGDINVQSDELQQKLTKQNELERVRFCLSFEDCSLPTRPFYLMYDRVYVDEKWLYIMKVRRRVYIAPGEKAKHQKARSKRFILKVMFLAAVARPRYDYRRRRWFDGKIGLGPFVQKVSAIRNSRNRPKGTLFTTSLNVNKDVYREYMRTKVYPDIREQWPGSSTRPIYVQQDNAKPHFTMKDTDMCQAGKMDGWDIRLDNQPPNSPDLNVLDLGFFNSVQSLQSKVVAKDIDSLIEAVQVAFRNTDHTKLSDNFITLQAVMNRVIEEDGTNDFPIPHLRKAHMRHIGKGISQVLCPPHVLKHGDAFLRKNESVQV